jgi:hypothetical protein
MNDHDKPGIKTETKDGSDLCFFQVQSPAVKRDQWPDVGTGFHRPGIDSTGGYTT